MIQPIPCPSCNGVGCANCNRVGFFGRDQQYDYYLTKDPTGNVRVAGIKQSGLAGKSILEKFFSLIFGFVHRQMQEPHDFIWAIKQKK